MEGNFFVPIGHMKQNFGYLDGLDDAKPRLETLLDKHVEFSGGHVGACVGFVRFCAFLAVAFEIRLDGAGLDDAEID